MKSLLFCCSLVVMGLLMACTSSESNAPESMEESTAASTDVLRMDNLFAWCVVPFDSLERSPEARIQMLKELGFPAYAYDWRVKHLDETARELQLARAEGVEPFAVWMWMDPASNQPGQLSAEHERLLEILADIQWSGQIWVGFPANYFEGMDDAQAVAAGAEMVAYLDERAQELDADIALYNHGAWFGEPANQVKVIEALPDRDIGIIYNFHHAHEQLDRFEAIVEVMLPYLWAVNLNGMRAEGPKILPLGQGNREWDMLDAIIEAGFEGPFGILGHVEEADVKEILTANLEGANTYQAP